MTMNTDVVVTCAVTGAGDTVDKHPAIPVTPEQIANSAIEAADAGAAIVHLHVRDPETGKGSHQMLNCFQPHAIFVFDAGAKAGFSDIVGMSGNALAVFGNVNAFKLNTGIGGGGVDIHMHKAPGMESDPVKSNDITDRGLHRLIAEHIPA